MTPLRPLLSQSCFPVFGSYPTRRLGKFTTNSSRPSALTSRGVLHEPVGSPPPGPPGPPGPRPPGLARTVFNPSRNWRSSRDPLLSASQAANHLENVPFNSSRVSTPSLSASATEKIPGPTNRPAPAPP